MFCLEKLLKPSYVNNEPDSIQINDTYNRIVMAVGYPRTIQEGWLDRIVSSEGNFDLSLHVEPASIELILGKLNQELVKQKSDILASETRGIVNPSLKVQYDDTYKTLQSLQTGEEKLFNLSFYVNARAFDKPELDLATRKIESELNSMMIIPKTPYFRMQQALQSIIPIAQDKLRIQRNIPSSPLAACFPFTSSFLDLKEDGVMFGVNINNNIPIILNQYDFANYNGLVLGSSGGGKSFFVKLYLIRNLLKNTQSYIIDPQGEYSDLCQKYDGQLVNISRDSDTIINPLDLMGRDFGDKLLSLMDLFRIMFGELTEVQKNTLDKALIQTYKNKGIHPNSPETWKQKPPVLSDLFEVLEQNARKASQIEKMTYDALLNRLQIYAHGSFSFMNKQTSLNLEKKLISFNIKEMPNQVKPALMFLVLDFIYEKTQKDRERKIIVVDEAWQLLRHGEHAEYLFKICKTARKFGAGLVIITQEVNDLLNSPAGNTILANTAWKLLLRQDPAVSIEITEKFGLNKEEKNFILTAEKGEGLLFAMNDRLPIKVLASEKEYDIITTNPEELRKREILREKLLENEDLSEEVYTLSKKHYPVSELNDKQIEFLKSAGYLETKQMGLEQGGPRAYLINPHPENESIDHKFLAQLLYEEIQKHTDKVARNAVQQADLVFVAKEKTIAFEIETGNSFHNPQELQEKIERLKKYKEWYFIVTQNSLRNAYKQHGPTLGRFEAKQKIEELFSA
ncbi:MAG: ATP-binding protein [Candidatus Micrarchaeota archaeon]